MTVKELVVIKEPVEAETVTVKELVVIMEPVEAEGAVALPEEIQAAGPLESPATAIEARVTMGSSTTIESSTIRSLGPSYFGTPAATMRTERNGAAP